MTAKASRPIRVVLTSAAILSLGGCATPAVPRKADALMDEVESRVRLPAEAAPLHAYARYYAFSGPGAILARYVIAADPPYAASPCSTAEEAPPCRSPAPGRVGAGQRRWLADPRGFPTVHDGGCAVVHVRYDLAAHKVESISCNGLA